MLVFQNELTTMSLASFQKFTSYFPKFGGHACDPAWTHPLRW